MRVSHAHFGPHIFDLYCRIINDVPLQEHITPHYVQLGLLKFPDIVKLNTCQFLHGYVYGDKSSVSTLFNFSIVSEQHNYATRSSQLQHLSFDLYRINIRKFCPTIIGTTFLCLLGLNPRNTLSDNPFFAIILLNTSFSDKPLLASVHVFILFPFCGVLMFNYSRLI